MVPGASVTAELAKLGVLVTLMGLLVLLGLVSLGGDATEAIRAVPYLVGGGMLGGAGLAAPYGLRHWGGQRSSSGSPTSPQPGSHQDEP